MEANFDEDIELDLCRTYPTHPYFNGSSSASLIEPLRRVLRAFSWRNPSQGYCQGLNFVAGQLLLFFTEEETFWMLVHLVEDILPPNYYSRV